MSPRVVFVDDDALVLGAYRNRLRRHRDRWDLGFFTSPHEALASIAEAPPAVVVTDVGMAEMSGAELLATVRELAPGATRIALSGQVEVLAATQILTVAHQYLAKPYDLDQLVEVLERRAQIEAMVASPDVVALVASAPTIPAAPRTFVALNRILEREDWSLDDLAAAIERDVVLTAKLVQVAASPFFSTRGSITSVRDAARLLGAKAVRQLALALEARSAFAAASIPLDVLDLEALARHSQAVAVRASAIAEPERALDAYVAGLVHELGILVLAVARPDALRAMHAASTGLSASARVALERETWGYAHPEVGAALLAMWGLPAAIVDAIQHQHDAEPMGLALCLSQACGGPATLRPPSLSPPNSAALQGDSR